MSLFQGAQMLDSRSLLCFVTCTDGSTYTLRSCIKGGLIEANEQLVDHPELLTQKVPAEIAVFHASKRVVVNLLHHQLCYLQPWWISALRLEHLITRCIIMKLCHSPDVTRVARSRLTNWMGCVCMCACVYSY